MTVGVVGVVGVKSGVFVRVMVVVVGVVRDV